MKRLYSKQPVGNHAINKPAWLGKEVMVGVRGLYCFFCRNIPYLNELSLLAYLASCSSSLFLISITSARDSDSTSCSSLSSPGCPSPQMVSYSLIRQNDHKLTLLRVLRRTYALYKWKKCHSRLGNWINEIRPELIIIVFHGSKSEDYVRD